MDSRRRKRRRRSEKRGQARGEGGRAENAAEPVSGERCSFVPHAIKPRQFYERGEPDDEVIYLPAGREG